MPIPKTVVSLLLATLLSIAACAPLNDSSRQSPTWQQTELYFGLSEPTGVTVSDADFKEFLDQSVTPKFPDGFTVLDGTGQYRETSGKIDHERNKILIVLHETKTLEGDNAKLDAIAKEYATRFHQESVLRTDRLVDAAFVSAPATGK